MAVRNRHPATGRSRFASLRYVRGERAPLRNRRPPREATRELQMGLWRTTSGRRMTRRLLGLIALLPFVAVSFPLPLPSGGDVQKDRSQPFPCQNRPCGCRSAQQCWQKCCCFSNAQKVAWAQQNRVAVPEDVVTAARREEQRAAETARHVCCSTPTPAVISRPLPQRTIHNRATQSRNSKRSVRVAAKSRSAETLAPAKIVIGALAGQCQGQDWSLAIVPAGMMPLASTPSLPMAPVARRVVPDSEFADSLSHRPPVPPPRRAAV